jgi:hypothetical protein
MIKKLGLFSILLLSFALLRANYLLLPMDETQTNHLKAYGFTYKALDAGFEAEWLLNYRGGSFCVPYTKNFLDSLLIKGIKYEVLSDAQHASISATISSPEQNMDVMKLQKAPKIAVYSPKSKMPWDDAVTMALTYAEIPYTVIFDDEVLNDELVKYDWLHLHHEDFTGQYGKFYASYHNQSWYQQQQREYEESALKHGFTKVSQLKLAVVQKIKEFTASGGFLFAMCSATDTYDIALAAENTDICAQMFDGDPAEANAQAKLNFDNTFAFKNFNLKENPFEYEYSTIDMQMQERGLSEQNDYFSLFTFSAKWDPVPTMLTQNHTRSVHGFMGQTTSFRKENVKSDVIILGENEAIGEVKYIHGTVGKGFFTFYGGHDPEDYQHFVGEEPTDLNLHPNSAGYRLILNNILFPAAKKKERKT